MNQPTSHKQAALALFEDGCQCAQATLCAFCDLTGLSMEQSMGLAASFGGGMARMREVCGALSGAFMAAGLILCRTKPGDTAAKDRHYRLTQYMAACFKQRMDSIYCHRILSLPPLAQTPVSTPRSPAFYSERSRCADAVAVAADVLDEILAAHESGTLDTVLSDARCVETTEFLNQR